MFETVYDIVDNDIEEVNIFKLVENYKRMYKFICEIQNELMKVECDCGDYNSLVLKLDYSLFNHDDIE